MAFSFKLKHSEKNHLPIGSNIKIWNALLWCEILNKYIQIGNISNQRLSRACIVHLVIKKNNWSYVKTMSCSGSHLGITINIKNTKFVKDLPFIDAQFRFIQCNSFREEYISVFSPYGSVLILWPVVAAILDFRPSNDHSWAVWFQLSKWFQRRSVLKHFSHRVQC